jgi:2-keto-4-pentenoate hydratase
MSHIPSRVGIGEARLGFDIPDLRFATEQGWPTGYELIADSLGARHWVIGEGISPKLFDANVMIELYRDDQLHSTAAATEVLRSPWAALAWLAQQKIDQGQPLQAGQVIFTGPPGKAYLPKSNATSPGSYRAVAGDFPSIEILVR